MVLMGELKMNKLGANELIKLMHETLDECDYDYKSALGSLQHFAAIEQRKFGKPFLFNEHLKGLIYSLLSNQRPWGPIEKNRDIIDKIFYNYDKESILKTEKSYFLNEIIRIKCGNRAIRKQMENLDYNIHKLEEIEEKFGSIDNFITSDNPNKIAKLLGNSKEYKVKQMGYALAFEYLRNVGIDTIKPDTHVRRILSNDRLSFSNGYPSEDETVIIAETISKNSGVGLAYLDGLLWIFCAKDYANICGGHPKCHLCKLKEYCNCGRWNLDLLI